MESLQGLYDSGRYVACIRAVEQRLPQLTGESRLGALWLAGKAAVHLSLWREATAYLTPVAEYDDTERGTKARVNLAYALIEYGEPAEAERLLLAQLQDKALPPSIRAEALHNLALSYERRRQYEQAAAVYRQAADQYMDAGRRQDALTSLQNATFMALVEGVPAGPDLLAAALAILHHGTERHRMVQLALEAYHSVQCGQNHHAVVTAEEVLQPNNVHATNWDRALAGYVAVRVAAAEGQTSIARALAERVRGWSVASQDVRLMGLISTLNDLEVESE